MATVSPAATVRLTASARSTRPRPRPCAERSTASRPIRAQGTGWLGSFRESRSGSEARSIDRALSVYRASGWIHVGTTQGRGRYDRDKLYDKPRKDIWLRPLRKDWKRTLNR